MAGVHLSSPTASEPWVFLRFNVVMRCSVRRVRTSFPPPARVFALFFPPYYQTGDDHITRYRLPRSPVIRRPHQISAFRSTIPILGMNGVVLLPFRRLAPAGGARSAALRQRERARTKVPSWPAGEPRNRRLTASLHLGGREPAGARTDAAIAPVEKESLLAWNSFGCSGATLLRLAIGRRSQNR